MPDLPTIERPRGVHPRQPPHADEKRLQQARISQPEVTCTASRPGAVKAETPGQLQALTKVQSFLANSLPPRAHEAQATTNHNATEQLKRPWSLRLKHHPRAPSQAEEEKEERSQSELTGSSTNVAMSKACPYCIVLWSLTLTACKRAALHNSSTRMTAHTASPVSKCCLGHPHPGQQRAHPRIQGRTRILLF